MGTVGEIQEETIPFRVAMVSFLRLIYFVHESGANDQWSVTPKKIINKVILEL